MRKAITALWVSVAALLSFGLVLVFSASSTEIGGAVPLLRTQACAAAIGIGLAYFAYKFDYRRYYDGRFLFTLFLFSIVLCSLVFLFKEIKGSRRWIKLAGVSIQPSEFGRVAVVIVISAWYAYAGTVARVIKKASPRRSAPVRAIINFYLASRDELIIPLTLLGMMVLPVVLSPDLGATAVFCVAAGSVMYIAGVKWRYLFFCILLGIMVFGAFMIVSPNRRDRVLSKIESFKGEESTRDTRYQVRQSLEAFYRGGVSGVGCGQSIQKYKYLTEANNDFIFAIAAEEFGLLGTSAILLGFIVFAACGFYISYHAVDRFGRYMAFGLTFMIASEALYNIGMVSDVFITKGLALPFISYGGSSLMATLASAGLIAGVGAVSLREKEGPVQAGRAREAIYAGDRRQPR